MLFTEIDELRWIWFWKVANYITIHKTKCLTHFWPAMVAELFWSKLNNLIILIYLYSTRQIICCNSFHFGSFSDLNHLFFYLFRFFAGYKLYRFDLATNQITKSTICPSLVNSFYSISKRKIVGIKLRDRPGRQLSGRASTL